MPRVTSQQRITDRLNLAAIADPATPVAGDLWLSSTTADAIKYRNAGDTATLTLATTAFVSSAVDTAVQALDLKASVRAIATTNLTLSGAQTVDGVALVAGDRILVAGQTTAAQNGIYLVAAGAWTRATDADTSADVTTGMFTFVSEGTANGSNGYALTTPEPIVLGTTALTFSQFSGAGQIIAGTGLAKSGNTLSTSAIPNASLSNSAITIAGTSTALGGSIALDTILGLSSTGLVKRTAANTLAIAVASTDYAPATSGSSILYGNGTGGFSSVTVGGNLSFSGGTLNLSSTYAGQNTITTTGALTSGSIASGFGTIQSTGIAIGASPIPNVLNILRADNTSANNVHILLERGSGAGTDASVQTLGDAANGIATVRLAVGGQSYDFSGTAFTAPGSITGGAISGTTGTFSGSISHSASSNSSVLGFAAANPNTGTAAWLVNSMSNSASSLYTALLGANWSGAFLTGGPTTQSAAIYTSTNIPISIGVQNTEVARFTATGLAVTGEISATTRFKSSTSAGSTTWSATGGELLANSVYGGVVSGYGSTADVALVNRAGGIAVYVPANTTNVVFGGSLNSTGSTGSIFTYSGAGEGLALQNSSDTSGTLYLGFRKSTGGIIGSITRVGTTDAVAYNTSSDIRLKTNIRDLTDSGSILDALRPVLHDWKSGTKGTYGFIAQEVYSVFPQAVSKGDDDPETITQAWAMDASKLVPVLVAETKSLRARVAHLESEIDND